MSEKPLSQFYPLKITRFITEWLRWNWYGRPTRGYMTRKAIFEICKNCDWSDTWEENELQEGECNFCGCRISTDKGRNKIYWATTSCPLKRTKWGKQKHKSWIVKLFNRS